MPFYEYECSSCKFYTEVMQKISDAPLTKCPSCGKKALKKLVSAPNFRLKGGGWYETDFKGDKENKRNLADGDKEEASSKSEAPEPAPTVDAAKADPKKGITAHGDTPKAEVAKPGKSDSKSPKASESKSAVAESHGRRRGKSSKTSKPAARPAASASKSRPTPSRSKPKSRPAKKKARR
jgi:putative FmdB family regulatory protein